MRVHATRQKVVDCRRVRPVTGFGCTQATTYPNDIIYILRQTKNFFVESVKYDSEYLVILPLAGQKYLMKPSADIDGKTKTGLPLVKLNLVYPFIEELDRRGIDADSIFSEHKLSREMLNSPELYVPAMVIYRLAEAVAETAGDSFLGVLVGESIDLHSWPPFVSAASKAASIGDFLLSYATNANRLASSVKTQLHTDGDYTTFRPYRVFEPSSPPAQVDGFYVGLFVNMVRQAAGDLWEPNEVLVRVCEPNVVPKGYFGVMISQCDNRGPSIQFPTAWLTKPIDVSNLTPPSKLNKQNEDSSASLRSALRDALIPYLHIHDLKIDRVAEICGYNTRTLGRRLHAEGTTITREIARLKEEHAIRMLTESDRPVSDIAVSLGFESPSAFTRSFKNWTGMSPRDYRRSNKDKRQRGQVLT